MIKFGPSGNSEAFYEAGYKHTEQAAEFCRQLNLDCFEYSFGRGILMSEDKAIKIGQAFKDSGIEISVRLISLILQIPMTRRRKNLTAMFLKARSSLR